MNQVSRTFIGTGLRDKTVAFLIHAGMSLPFFIGLIVLVKLIWYPDFYYHTQNIQGFLVVVFLVDVVLGPLLTFVVYKKNKPSLKFDLGVIVLFQLVILFYGVSIVYKERPLYLVYTTNYFVVVPANTIDEGAIKFPELKQDLPRIVATDQPDSAQERQEIMMSVLDGGSDIHQLPHLYSPITRMREAMDKKGMAITDLPKTITAEIESRWPGKNRSELRAYAFVPEKTHDQLLIWDLASEAMLGLIDIDPWALVNK